ncbi:MAG: LptF/LptG family permease, partial [Candidatus Zixiibacteriota bacterium]
FTPFIIVLTCPIATLLASIFSIGLMAKSNELLAMKAAGVSLYCIVTTMVAGGILIAIGLWVFGEMILPEANSRKNIIQAEKFERRSSESATVYRNQMFQGLHGRVFQFTNYVSKSATGEDVVIQTF